MSKNIALTQGKFAIVDDDDYEWLSKWKWLFDGYAKRHQYISPTSYKTIYMHREILGNPDGKDIDHINRNTLDNRRSNLRAIETWQNIARKGVQSNNTSGYKGVFREKRRNKWYAVIMATKLGIKKYLGQYDDILDAVAAYDRAAIEIYGEFAYTNFPRENYQ